MKTLYKILRTLILCLLAMVLIVPSMLFVGLELDCVQNPARKRAEKELSEVLGVDVSIGKVSIYPFNRLTLRNITLCGLDGDSIASLRRIGAGVDLTQLVFSHRLVFGYAEIIGLDAHLKRDSVNGPLNIQPIIDALRPKDENQVKKDFDVAIRTVILRGSSLSYHVGVPDNDSTTFNKNHILIKNLRADVRLPLLSPDSISIDLNRLAFDISNSNFSVSSICGNILIGRELLTLENPCIEFNSSALYFSNIVVPIKGDSSFITRFDRNPINIAIDPKSHINLSDLNYFVNAATLPDLVFLPEAYLFIKSRKIDISKLAINSDVGSLELLNAQLCNPFSSDSIAIDMPHLIARIDSRRLGSTMRTASTKKMVALTLMENAERVEANLHAHLTRSESRLSGTIASKCGSIDVNAEIISGNGNRDFTADFKNINIDLKTLLDKVVKSSQLLSNLESEIHLNGCITPDWKLKSTQGTLNITKFIYRGMNFKDLTISGNCSNAGNSNLSIDAEILSNNKYADIDCSGHFEIEKNVKHLTLSSMVRHLSTQLFSEKYPTGNIAGNFEMQLTGSDIENIDGRVAINDISCRLDSVSYAHLGNVCCELTSDESQPRISLQSDLIDMEIRGVYSFKSLVSDSKAILSSVLPSIPVFNTPRVKSVADLKNCFEYDIVIKPTLTLNELIKLPLNALEEITICGTVDAEAGNLSLNFDAPYLLQGKKIIENTILTASITQDDTSKPRGSLSFSSLVPTKKDKATIGLFATALSDRIDTRLSWLMADNTAGSGDIDCSIKFQPDCVSEKSQLLTSLHFNDGKAVFNDTVWKINPSDVQIVGKRIKVDNFRIDGYDQFLSINGVVSESTADSLHLSLHNIDLDYIFETLAINNAMFGGRANGNFYGAALLSPSPRLYTDDLKVAGIKYNHCWMGDAKIKSGWDMDRKAVTIYADIFGINGNKSVIDGFIKPLSEELDFKFHADDVPVGFLLPFMEAFTSAVDGHASGDAHLYGTFKYLDMTGDLYARDFKLKLDFTNCWYSTTDSIKLRPGRIDIPGVSISDVYGNTGTLSGIVTHKCFKEPRFRFNVTDARNMLLYDIAENPDLNWYGRIFGNGGADIVGEPGKIDIVVTASTAPGSTFTFVLSDAEQAYDYNFITFRDKSGKVKADCTLRPIIVRKVEELIARQPETEIPSVYNMNIAVDVNDNVLMTLVMDPAGGDKIRAHGNGNLRMTYSSSDEKLGMYGNYVLSEGAYNFTLQDIIIKDFKIREGSKIAFNGDPYTASLNVEAVYSLNANLNDLDESFSQDRELSRTNVPIHALLNVTGNIRQPEVNFDLEFPTLTQDTYRKVKSIISTEEMMNRQIIYLLALNRFYTPDYMANASKGNELVSVASSTISSQLANMLGQLSENWTIAPNFRSDKGDFSDVEFDVALSSRLLNNRLIFNGNLGYRDKTLNNNSFIGDFDLEYLLNRSGSLRLKAYNRYNDRNFYVKSALTTQGVGIMYKRDFNDMFAFLRRKKKSAITDSHTIQSDSAASDSVFNKTLIQLPATIPSITD